MPVKPLVKVTEESYPELAAELKRLPERKRAERLRHLAALGLMSERAGFTPAHPPLEPEAGPEAEAHQDQNDKRREQILGRFASSLD